MFSSLALRSMTWRRAATASTRWALCSRSLAATPESAQSEVQSPSGTPSSGMSTPTPRHVLSPYERFVVRITRSHRDGEIPTTMGPEEMDRVNSRFRIGLMILMMVITLGVCLCAIQQGKREKEAHSNKMVYARNRERYK